MSELSDSEARELTVRAGKAFQPRTPISTRELFAGRWEQITTLVDAVNQTGLHVLIYGERGVGKTSLANVVKPVVEVFDAKDGAPYHGGRVIIKMNSESGDTFGSIWDKILRELTWLDDKPAFGLAKHGTVDRQETRAAFNLPQQLGVDDVRRVVSRLPGAVFIVDEFDRAAPKASKQFTDLIKALSDMSVDVTIILVGVSDTVDTLVQDHASISRAITQIMLPRMQRRELREILTKGAELLKVSFAEDAASMIVHMSQGLPHYTHLLGLSSVRAAANNRSTVITSQDVIRALGDAVKQAQQSVTEKYSRAVHSSHKDALYKQVLLACGITAAKSQDALGYFNAAAVAEPLTKILQRAEPISIAAFNGHMSEFCKEERGHVLEKIGLPRAHRYRFHDPLLVPYVFMDAITRGLVQSEDLLPDPGH